MSKIRPNALLSYRNVPMEVSHRDLPCELIVSDQRLSFEFHDPEEEANTVIVGTPAGGDAWTLSAYNDPKLKGLLTRKSPILFEGEYTEGFVKIVMMDAG
jgi:hypothetical protein